MKLKEFRLLNITVKQDGNIIYQGETENLPQELKEQTYQKIYFEGVNLVVEL